MARLLVAFTLGGEDFALPVEHVREVVAATEPRRLQSTDPLLRGVLDLRGTLVPVYDLARRLGADGAGSGPVVVVEVGPAVFGVVVDAVREVLDVPDDAVAAPPASTDESVEALAHANGRLVAVLRPDRLFALPAAPAATRAAPRRRTPRPPATG